MSKPAPLKLTLSPATLDTLRKFAGGGKDPSASLDYMICTTSLLHQALALGGPVTLVQESDGEIAVQIGTGEGARQGAGPGIEEALAGALAFHGGRFLG